MHTFIYKVEAVSVVYLNKINIIILNIHKYIYTVHTFYVMMIMMMMRMMRGV